MYYSQWEPGVNHDKRYQKYYTLQQLVRDGHPQSSSCSDRPLRGYLLGGDTGPSVVSRRSETEQGILCINEDMVKHDMVGLGNEVYLWDEYVRVRTLWILTVDTHRNIQIFKSQKIITHITPNRESRKIQKGPPKGKEGVYKEKSDFLRENDQ